MGTFPPPLVGAHKARRTPRCSPAAPPSSDIPLYGNPSYDRRSALHRMKHTPLVILQFGSPESDSTSELCLRRVLTNAKE